MLHRSVSQSRGKRSTNKLVPNTQTLSDRLTQHRSIRRVTPPSTSIPHSAFQDHKSTGDFHIAAAAESNIEFTDSEDMNDSKNHTSSQSPLIQQIRTWIKNAEAASRLDTAIFWTDKLASITGVNEDKLCLANLYVLRHDYSRAFKLIENQPDLLRSSRGLYLAALSLIKLEKWHVAQNLLEENLDLSCRDGKQFESSLFWCRAMCYLHTGSKEQAKQALIASLHSDPSNVESFEALLSNDFVKHDEITRILENILDDNMKGKEILHALYAASASRDELNQKSTHIEQLCTFGLQENHLVLLKKAEMAFSQFQFEEALQNVERILAKDPYNEEGLIMQICCLHSLGTKNKLFMISHQLVEDFPQNPISWFSVGTYYLTIKKFQEARRYYSKSTLLLPDFFLGWIGFAHSFALEGEHDQAVAAYSTAFRMRPKNHWPKLFLGMDHLAVFNLDLAREYFMSALDISPNDPIVLNELGMVLMEKNLCSEARDLFEKALKHPQCSARNNGFIEILECNLGTACYKLGDYETGRKLFQNAVWTNKTSHVAYGGLAMISYSEGKLNEAIQHLHSGLACNDSDAFCTEFLQRCLEEKAEMPLEDILDLENDFITGESDIEHEQDEVNDGDVEWEYLNEADSFTPAPAPTLPGSDDGSLSPIPKSGPRKFVSYSASKAATAAATNTPRITRTRVSRRESNLDDPQYDLESSEIEAPTEIKRGLIDFKALASSSTSTARMQPQDDFVLEKTPSPQPWPSFAEQKAGAGHRTLEDLSSSPDHLVRDSWVVSSKFSQESRMISASKSQETSHRAIDLSHHSPGNSSAGDESGTDDGVDMDTDVSD